MINRELKDSALSSDVLNSVFDKWWEELDQNVREVLERPDEPEAKSMRTDKDLLEEILELSRSIAGRTQHSATVSGTLVEDLVTSYSEAVQVALAFDASEPFVDTLISSFYSMNLTLGSLIRESSWSRKSQGRLAAQIRTAENSLNDWYRQRKELSDQQTDDVPLNEEGFDDIPF